MIAEPYICINARTNCIPGVIEWLPVGPEHEEPNEKFWQPYAEFEREKLKEIVGKIDIGSPYGYCVEVEREANERHFSTLLIGYSYRDLEGDSESNRLLKRAEFLKAVCGKVCVEWLAN